MTDRTNGLNPQRTSIAQLNMRPILLFFTVALVALAVSVAVIISHGPHQRPLCALFKICMHSPIEVMGTSNSYYPTLGTKVKKILEDYLACGEELGGRATLYCNNNIFIFYLPSRRCFVLKKISTLINAETFLELLVIHFFKKIDLRLLTGKGEKIFDYWGGWTDAQKTSKWDHRTLSLVFSSTKIVTAITVAMLVDRGLLDYDKPVAAYWSVHMHALVRHVTTSAR